MDAKVCIFWLLSLSPLSAVAANISGFVTDGYGKPLAGAAIQFSCGNKAASFTTDNNGRYRARSLPNGRWCQVSVEYGKRGRSPQVRVHSGRGRKDINLRLTPGKGGSGWQLTL